MNSLKKNLLTTILSLISIVPIGIGQQNQNPKSTITYHPSYVPIPQGKFVHVGTFTFKEEFPLANAVIEIGITSGEPLQEVQLTTKINETETLVISKSEIMGETVRLILPENLPKGISQIGLSVKAGSGHHLKDRIGILPKSITSNSKIDSITISREVSAYRLAKPLRTYEDDGINSFRIPGLVTSTKGTLLAVYDIRRNSSRDLQGDIDVGLSRSTDGGITWAPMKVIIDMGQFGGLPEDQNGIGDPAILVDHETGHIWVAALWMHGKPGEMAWNSSKPGMTPEETGQFVLVKSEDDGLTWSEPMVITDQIKNPEWNLFFNGPGKGITLNDGTLVFPAQFKDKDQLPHSTIIYSKDKGKTWKVGTGAKSNTTEAQVVQLQDGSLMLNMRDNRGGSRSVAITKDLGTTWTEHETSRKSLPEPICMASIIDNPYQPSMLLFSNPATEKGRNHITIKASQNDGETWPSGIQLLLDEGTGWGYSCLTMINKEEVGILYESSVANITFQIVPLKEILGEK